MQTPDNTNRLRRLSKPSPPENESVKRYIMSSQSDPDSPPVDIDPSVIHHATVSAGLSSLQYQQIKLSKENQSLRDDIDALEQYGRRDLLRINGIPDGGSSETSEQTTELVKELLKSVDKSIDTNDVVRSHRIGQPRTGSVNANGARNSVPPRPRQVIVKLKDHFAKKRILKCKKAMRENRDLRYIRVNEDLTKIRNTIAFKARQLRIEHHIRDTWTVNGKIFVKDNIEQVHQVNTMAAFLNFVSVYCCPGAQNFLDRLDYNRKLQRPPSYETPRRLRTYAETLSTAPTVSDANLESGSLETNPGPNDDLNSSGSTVNIADLSNFSELFSKSVSFLHLNIQSIVPKLDLIEAEYDEFDILAFTESWLNNNNTDESIKLLNYHSPFRRDRGPQKNRRWSCRIC
ncbi:unnamed protein product [Mytilus coruscus]|uniref:Uncharacterized protein n=1 Tax=Mytilus coruscus TaxID=42192 RepID=A0A6J8EG61_MYTCO|nr:unnamed protein product [Mytilus coruscus]